MVEFVVQILSEPAKSKVVNSSIKTDVVIFNFLNKFLMKKVIKNVKIFEQVGQCFGD